MKIVCKDKQNINMLSILAQNIEEMEVFSNVKYIFYEIIYIRAIIFDIFQIFSTLFWK